MTSNAELEFGALGVLVLGGAELELGAPEVQPLGEGPEPGLLALEGQGLEESLRSLVDFVRGPGGARGAELLDERADGVEVLSASLAHAIAWKPAGEGRSGNGGLLRVARGLMDWWIGGLMDWWVMGGEGCGRVAGAGLGGVAGLGGPAGFLEPLDRFGQGVAGGVVGDRGLALW